MFGIDLELKNSTHKFVFHLLWQVSLSESVTLGGRLGRNARRRASKATCSHQKSRTQRGLRVLVYCFLSRGVGLVRGGEGCCKSTPNPGFLLPPIWLHSSRSRGPAAEDGANDYPAGLSQSPGVLPSPSPSPTSSLCGLANGWPPSRFIRIDSPYHSIGL